MTVSAVARPRPPDRSEGVSLPPPVQEDIVDAVRAAAKAAQEATTVLARKR